MDKPKFIMLIGLPASGKSNYAAELHKEYPESDMHSSDTIRKELYGNELTQGNSDEIFGEMRRRTINSLKASRTVIYDATNISRKNRTHLLSCLPKDVEKIACVVWARYETCVERYKHRERQVGKSVIDKMIRNFKPPFYDEGWDNILVHYTDDKYTESDYNGWLDCQHDNPHHKNTVAEHTTAVCNAAFEQSYEALKKDMFTSALLGTIIMFAAAMHDTGKKFTKSFVNSKGETTNVAHFYDHHNVGSYYSLGFDRLSSLGLRETIMVSWLVNVHMEPFFGSKYYMSLKPEYKWMVDVLHKCDLEGA